MPTLKKIFIITFLLVFPLSLYARSVNWSPESMIIIYALVYVPGILISLLLAFFLPKLFKKKPKGLLKYIVIRAIGIYIIWHMIGVMYIAFTTYIYRPNFTSLKDLKELSLPIKKAVITHCEETKNYPSSSSEIASLLRPIGFTRDQPEFSKTGYLYKDIQLFIERSFNSDNDYVLKLSSNTSSHYYMYFDKSCNHIGGKQRKGKKGLFN